MAKRNAKHFVFPKLTYPKTTYCVFFNATEAQFCSILDKDTGISHRAVDRRGDFKVIMIRKEFLFLIALFATIVVVGCTGDSLLTPEPEPEPESDIEKVEQPEAIYVSGKFDYIKSKTREVWVGTTRFDYIDEVYITQNNGSCLLIVLDPPLNRIQNRSTLLSAGDLVLFELYSMIKPGIWNGKLVENFTKTITFE